MASGQDAEGALGVVSFPNALKNAERDGGHGGTMEEGDVVISVQICAMVKNGCLDFMLMGCIVRRETKRDICGIVEYIVVTVVDKHGIVVVVVVNHTVCMST